MPFPIIPVLSGIAGMGAGAGIMGALSGGKKEIVKHAPYEYYAPTISKTTQTTYAPQVQYSPQISYAYHCLLYTSPSPRDRQKSRMPSSA